MFYTLKRNPQDAFNFTEISISREVPSVL